MGVRLPLLPLSRSGVVESARRATVNREAQVRSLPPEFHAPVVERAMTPGPQPGSCGFESRRGYLGALGEPPGSPRPPPLVRFADKRCALAVGEVATPPASGAGDRRFDSCRPDLRGGGAVFLASLMSSRRGFESHPRDVLRGRSSDGKSTRLSGDRSPVRVRSSPLHGGRGVEEAPGVVSPEAPVRARSTALAGSCGR